MWYTFFVVCIFNLNTCFYLTTNSKAWTYCSFCTRSNPLSFFGHNFLNLFLIFLKRQVLTTMPKLFLSFWTPRIFCLIVLSFLCYIYCSRMFLIVHILVYDHCAQLQPQFDVLYTVSHVILESFLHTLKIADLVTAWMRSLKLK